MPPYGAYMPKSAAAEFEPAACREVKDRASETRLSLKITSTGWVVVPRASQQ